MKTMKSVMIFGALFAALSVRCPVLHAGMSVQQLGWLTGCWEQQSPEGHFEEYWMPAAGKTILHMGRMTSGSKTLFYETLQIREENDQLRLLVTINGKKRVEFDAVESGPTRVVFQTPAGARKERLTYEQASPDHLKVRLQKTGKEGETREDFDLTRADCNGVLHHASK